MKVLKYQVLFLFVFLIRIVCIAQPEESHFERGVNFHKSGKYDSALLFLELAVTDIDSNENPRLWVQAHNWLGWTYMDLAHYNKADSVLRFSLDFGIKTFGEEDLDNAFAYHILSKTFGTQTKYTRSNNYEKAALRIRRKILGDEDPELAKSYEMFGFNARQQGLYDSAIYFYEKALYILVSSVGLEDLKTARIYAGLAWVYGAKGELQKSLDYNKLALRIRKDKLGDEHPLTLATLSHNCWCYNSFGNYDRALTCYEEVLERRIEVFGIDHPLISNAYKNIGYTSAQLGNYEKSIYYHSQGIKLIEEKYESNKLLLVRFYGLIASSYKANRDTLKFLEYVNKAIGVGEKSLYKDHPELVQPYRLLASYSNETGNRVDQLRYLKHALRISEKRFGTKHSYSATLYSLFGEYYAEVDRIDLAFEYHHKSLNTFISVFGDEHPQVAVQLGRIAKLHSELQDVDSSLLYYQKALYSITDNFETADVLSSPDRSQLTSEFAAINILLNKGKALLSKSKSSDNPLTYLHAAVDCFGTSIDLIDSLRNSYTTEKAKQQLYDDGSIVYDLSIIALKEIYDQTNDIKYLNDAFEISERSRAFILLNTLNNHIASNFSGVPDSTILKERDLKVELAYYKRKKFKLKVQNDSLANSKINDEIFKRQIQYDELIRDIEETYPDYYTLKYDQEIIKPERIRTGLLNSNQAVLEFFVTSDRIFLFSISTDKTLWYEAELPQNLTRLVNDHRKSISDYQFIMNNSKVADEVYSTSAFELYKILLSGALNDLPNGVNQLIIVSDDILSQVNMESLLTEKVQNENINYASLPYLINKYNVSYTYSISFLSKSHSVQSNNADLPFGGFAPVYINRSTYSENKEWSIQLANNTTTLTGALDEVTKIADIMNGDTWLGDQATESNFKSNAGNYRTLHLAMHGILDDKNPLYSELLFTETKDSINNGKLDISEIYNLKLNADLVVLSACNTGSGKIQQGEGTMSMSRAFAYAGCPSVIMSLWKIPDDITSNLMVNLYLDLKNQASKDEALKNAKLKYLNRSQDPHLYHPYFWAGFVLMGDAQPVDVERFSYAWIVALGILFLALVVYFIRRTSIRH